MRIVFCASQTEPGRWIEGLQRLLPDATIVNFDPGERDPAPADYAVVWAPPAALFEYQRHLKAIFNLGAGMDALLSLPNVPKDLPLIRLGDAGMSVQMAEYVCHAIVRYARELDTFESDLKAGTWSFRKPTIRSHYPVGVMGLGVIGARVAQSVASFEYPVSGWSRSPRSVAGVECFHGAAALGSFLRAVRILVCVLPLTPETDSILNRENLSKLRPGGYLINVARGAHLVETDLLALLDSGHLAGATLDVFREEPLPAQHPFWNHPKITMTPHIAARTLRDLTLAQIAGKIARLEQGESVQGMVDLQRGY
jgi:glyoxylate/hydroxypyruvate reductase A